MQLIRVKTNRRTQMIDITHEVQLVVSALGLSTGTCLLYVPHTTAGILINEHLMPKAPWIGSFPRPDLTAMRKATLTPM